MSSYPPGIRFVPTDQELIIEYLKKKINNQPLPIQDIRVVNLYEFTPDFLAGNYPPVGEKEWYFFTPRNRKYPKGSRPNRSISIGNKVEGYWKASGADKAIKCDKLVIGYKKSLVFYKGKHPHGQKTNWIMHEYTSHHPRTNKKRDASDHMKLDDYVLCRIHIHNKGKGLSKKKDIENDGPTIDVQEDEQLGAQDDYREMAIVQYEDSLPPVSTLEDTGTTIDLESLFATEEALPIDHIQFPGDNCIQQQQELPNYNQHQIFQESFDFSGTINQNQGDQLCENNHGIISGYLENGTNLVYSDNMVQNNQEWNLVPHVHYYDQQQQIFQEGSSSLTQNLENFNLPFAINNGVSDSSVATHDDYVANLVYGDMVQNRQAGSFHDQQVSNSSNNIISPFETRYYESSVEADSSYYSPDLYDGQMPRKRPHLC